MVSGYAYHIITLLFVFITAASADENITDIRERYHEADKALTLGDLEGFNKFRAELLRYPLLPYLDYKALIRRLDDASDAEIDEFLTRYSDTPLSEKLRAQWLKKVSKRGDNKAFIRFYRETDDTELDCQYRVALLREGKAKDAIANFAELWITGFTLPDACDPLISHWREMGGLTDELIWKRLRAAIKLSKLTLATELTEFLPATSKPAALLYQRVHADPRLIIDDNLFSVQNSNYREIALYGLRRLAYRDLDEALVQWTRLMARFYFSPMERTETQILIGLLLAQDRRSEALAWMMNFTASQETPRLREWRVRTAIFNQNWPYVLTAIGWLDELQQKETRWQYWRARALDKLGVLTEAQKIFAQAASLRDYHGFLAADRISRPYSFQNKPIEFTADELETIEQIPGILRARELYAMNRIVDARREWEYTRKYLNDQLMIGVAKLAQKWGWHSRAIASAAQSGYYDDVSMRFPLSYQDEVQNRAEQLNIEPHWIYGILRQESAFVEDARSEKGALGLMQLMPQTGRHIAKRVGKPLRNNYELLNPERNIQLGSAYLREMRAKLFNHPVLATAAYNAGAQKVMRWLPKTESVEADIWIETIPYDETRDYLERVLAFTLIYDWRIDEETMVLLSFMRPIEPVTNTEAVINKNTVGESPNGSS